MSVQVDVDALKARTDIVEVVRRYVSEIKLRGREWWACCPFHQETTPSFKVDPSGWFICFGCSAKGDVLKFVELAESCDFKRAIEILTGDPTPPPAKWMPKDEEPPPPNFPVPDDAPECTFTSVKILVPPDEAWAYRAPNGKLLGYDARYNKRNGKKSILPWRFVNGKWVSKGFADPRPLYGLEELAKYPDRIVVIVEGCKCCEAARKLFGDMAVVVTWPGGVDSWRKVDWSPLAGRIVLLWPDADADERKGQACMLGIANKLLHSAARVTYFDPNPKPRACPGTSRIENKITVWDACAGEDCPTCGGSGTLVLEPMPDGWDVADAVEEGWDIARWRKWAELRVQVIEQKIAEIDEDAEEKATAKLKEEIAVAEAQGIPMTYQRMWVEWGLRRPDAGIPYPSLDNVCKILEHDPMLQGFVYYDQFLGKVWNVHSKRPWADEDEINLQLYIQRNINLQKVSRQVVQDAVVFVAMKDQRHQVRDWMETLEWDRVERIPTFFEDYFGTPNNAYTQAVGRCFLLSMVARTYLPGCKADLMVVLEGPQGIKKSSALRSLVGRRWYADISGDPSSKDFLQDIQGKLLIEIGEMGAFRKAENESVKQMLSRQSDTFRNSYGRHSKDWPRQCIFAGTTNHSNSNRDETGARRFLYLRCTTIDKQGIERHREQIFAEAVAKFKLIGPELLEWERTNTDGLIAEEKRSELGADWWMTPVAETKAEQDARFEDDPWTEPVMTYIVGKPVVSAAELLTEALKIDTGRQGLGELRRLGSIMRRADWIRHGTGRDRYWRPRESEWEI